MKKRAWLILGLFFIWGVGSTYWYVCKIKGFCNEQNSEQAAKDTIDSEDFTAVPASEKEKKDIVYFKKDSINPIINNQEKWTAEVKSLKELQQEGKKLFIYGPYYAWEQSPNGFDNLGLARASALKKLLSSEIDTALILTRARLLTDRDKGNYISGLEGVYQWQTYNDYVKEETPESILVYFPYNSDKEIKNKEIILFLDDLSGLLKKNPKEKIQIIGHTDDIGNNQSNIYLSQKRAERMKRVLIQKGVDPTQIEVVAKGEEEPVANNTTESGRQKNRRVEIKIIK